MNNRRSGLGYGYRLFERQLVLWRYLNLRDCISDLKIFCDYEMCRLLVDEWPAGMIMTVS